MFSDMTNDMALRRWGWLSERHSVGVTVGMNVVHIFCDGGVSLHLSDIAAKMIKNKNCLKKYRDDKKFILENCCCALCKKNVGELRICSCVNNIKNHEDLPSSPFFISFKKNRQKTIELDNFFTTLRKRAREYEYGANIYSPIRQAKISVSGYKINQDDTKKVWEIQNGNCFYCGGTLGFLEKRGNFHIDHLIPLSSGGEHIPLNLVIACAACNLQKCIKSEEAFLRELSRDRADGWLKERQEIIGSMKKERSLVF